MNNDWKNYLLDKAEGFTENTGFRFSDEAENNFKADNNDIICDLSQFSTIVVAGEDAADFMQGQFTNDIKLVTANNSQLNAFCNNKGRTTANFRLFQHQQNYFFSVKSNLVEQCIAHLQNYILRAQVVIQDVSTQLVHLGISGSNAEKLLSSFVKITDSNIDHVSFNENYVVIRIASAQTDIPRYEVFCTFEHAKAVWESVSAQAEIVNSSSWDYLNIQAGLPFIDADSSEEFVPQMINMDLINGISFTKGCFTGQEIVARMHYLGKLKKRCFKIHIASDEKPASGESLFAENAKAGKNTGMIIQAEKNPETGYDALAVIQIADTESKLFLKDADGALVTVRQLPYSFDAE